MQVPSPNLVSLDSPASIYELLEKKIHIHTNVYIYIERVRCYLIKKCKTV